ncbi:dihydroxyacetone kinase subunit L [Streptomyces sp. AJS327]|nr:dihydroxyacetone kinase subunit L [Streptomyces sp. AJS327]
MSEAPTGGVTEVDAGFVVRWLEAAAVAIDRASGELTELDSAIGDGDHGSNMRRGFAAVGETFRGEPPTTPGAALTVAGRRLVSTVGGASGPLYGTLLRRAGKALGEAERVSGAEFGEALRAGTDAVAQLGGAVRGDKTMLDALYPAVEVLCSGGAAGLDVAAAHRAAAEGAEATVPLRARKGRASYLGERSEGHRDPGAVSSALLVGALALAAEGDDDE